ncbi:MAG TPA: protein kinase [Luteimonas sp.]|nr:protein kinase [Luteimonas sp.]
MQQPTNPSSGIPGPIQADADSFPSIAGYRFRKRLGQGGMATVYLATQESLDRPVSIKVMAREALRDETSKQRFENEARTIAKLSHTGIVGIHEVGRTSDGQMYYVMPYLPNGDLSQRDLRNDEAQITEILRALLAALGYAHSHGIVHRDVKEENVLFDIHNRPLLTDFGIARTKTDTSRLTRDGLSVGSSAFMAPEQARGEEVDGRADLYSVGVLTFALLTGHLPFRATDPLALAIMHAQDPVPRLPAEKSHWQGFINRAMAKSPAQRFANAEQMLQALAKVEHGTGNDLPGRVRQWFERAKQNIGERKRIVMLALAGALLLATGLYAADAWFAEPDETVAATIPAPSPASDTTPEKIAPQLPAAPATLAPLVDSVATDSPPAAGQSTALPESDKPTSSPGKTTAQKSAKPAPARPVTAKQSPAKKVKGWFSRLFRHR